MNDLKTIGLEIKKNVPSKKELLSQNPSFKLDSFDLKTECYKIDNNEGEILTVVFDIEGNMYNVLYTTYYINIEK